MTDSLFILTLGDSIVEFLDGGQDQPGIIGQLVDQSRGIVRDVYASLFKGIELIHGLVIQVLAIHYV